jgi:alkylhydroperoxidase family enzyme
VLATEGARPLRIEEPGGRWSVVELPADPRRALVLAAAGVLVGCPDTDGKARALELLQAGGDAAALVAVTVLREAFGGALHA